ncbi:MAG TPA: DUF6485 family protein [Thermodesulfobacteriota bacterium]|nr:DUF6485 family protein [Thermodesulfobacteriota bacterium]
MSSTEEMAKKCPNIKENLKSCTCSYEPCSRKGLCCQCIQYHRRSGELPACYFPPEVEKTYDRSISRFIQSRK